MNNNGPINAAPEEVRRSDYGCKNCLWVGAECRLGSQYKPFTLAGGTQGEESYPSCGSYTFYN